MNIIQLLEEHRSKRKYYSSKTEAIEKFDSMKRDIEAIQEAPGFKAIKDYWLNRFEGAVARLRTCNRMSDDFPKIQAAMEEAEDFITFLDNLTK